MSRNLRLVPYHLASTRAAFWTPIFVLFTRGEFGLEGALALGSFYYLSVVVLEVPSGWMSDRLGRVVTLRLAALGFVGSHTCFLLAGSNFTAVAAGQALLAVGYASLSGTNLAFHYDSLEAVDRAEEFAEQRSRVQAVGYAVAAGATLTGGALGLINLRLAFAASLLMAFGQLVLTLFLSEPPRSGVAESPSRQIVTCLRYLANPYLGWIFFYGIIMVTLEHVAFTNSQPWLTEVLGFSESDVGSTPIVSGLTLAIVALVGAGAARLSAPASDRFGPVATLIGLAVLSAVIVTAMALSFHWLVIGLLALRSVHGAVAPVIIGAEVAPRVAQEHRATLLSLNSLAGRLGYGLLLAVVADAVVDQVDPRAQVVEALGLVTIVSWAMVVALAVSVAMVGVNRLARA